MTNLYLSFNRTFEEVKLELTGAGTLIIEKMKREHKDVLCHELVNYIRHEEPYKLEFVGEINFQLINELSTAGITYNYESKKLTYKD